MAIMKSPLSLACELSVSKFILYVIRIAGWCYAFHIPSILATADVYMLQTRSGNTCRDEFFFFAYRHRGDYTAVPLIHDIILRTGYLGHYESVDLARQNSEHPSAKNSIWSGLVIHTQCNMIFTQQIIQTQQSTVYNCIL
jgi:hypothetical protein